MRIAAISILMALTYLAVAMFNRPIHVQPLELPPAPSARNNIHFPKQEWHPASPSPSTSTYVNIIVVHP